MSASETYTRRMPGGADPPLCMPLMTRNYTLIAIQYIDKEPRQERLSASLVVSA